MQTFQIEVEDQIANKVLHFLENLKGAVSIKRVNRTLDNFNYENNYPESLVISSIEEVRARVYEAEQQKGLTEDEYNILMDKFFREELGIER